MMEAHYQKKDFESGDNEPKINQLWRQNSQGRIERSHYNDINPLIREYLRENHREGALLDLGCGYGQMANIFQKIGFQVTAIDGDCNRIANAKSDFPEINFFCHTIKVNLPFEDNTFDVIFSRSVFQYLDHEPILIECKRVLKKEGSIIFLENLKNNPITKIGRTWLKLSGEKYHSYPWNHFTVTELTKVANDFVNPSLHYFHLLSPLSYFDKFKFLYPLLNKIDRKLLHIKFLRYFAWLVLFTAKNKK